MGNECVRKEKGAERGTVGLTTPTLTEEVGTTVSAKSDEEGTEEGKKEKTTSKVSEGEEDDEEGTAEGRIGDGGESGSEEKVCKFF